MAGSRTPSVLHVATGLAKADESRSLHSEQSLRVHDQVPVAHDITSSSNGG